MARKQPGKVGENKTEIVREVPMACADEAHAVEFMEKLRWGDCPACPRCGSVNVYQMKKRGTDEREANYRWRCRDCAKQHSVRKGAVFEDSRIPLRHWCYAFWAACASKKGVSAKQIQRQTGLSYKSALFMMHRIRWAMAGDEPGQPMLKGTVEVDETFVGGKPRNPTPQRPKTFRDRNKTRVYKKEKQPVFAALCRETGVVRTRVVPSVTKITLKAAIDDMVDKSSRLMSDEASAYTVVGREFTSHETVKHGAYEYARGDVTTNTVEGFFSILKRGIYGTFHNVSREHLHRYCDEFAFRYNTRKLDDGERVRRAIQASEGRRLTYREPVAQSA